MDGAEEDEDDVNDDTDSIGHTRHYGGHSICVDIWLVLAEMGKAENVARSGRSNFEASNEIVALKHFGSRESIYLLQ